MTINMTTAITQLGLLLLLVVGLVLVVVVSTYINSTIFVFILPVLCAYYFNSIHGIFISQTANAYCTA